MRVTVLMLALTLGACGSESPREEQTAAAPPAAAAMTPPAASAASSPAAQLMAIPDDPKALKRLTAMGYTVHEEQGHLHAPGLTGCPAMGGGPTM